MIMIICRRQSVLCREVVYIEKSIAETFQLVNFKPIIVNKVSPMPSFVYQRLIQDSVPPFTILFNDVDFKSTTYLKIINGSLVDIHITDSTQLGVFKGASYAVFRVFRIRVLLIRIGTKSGCGTEKSGSGIRIHVKITP